MNLVIDKGNTTTKIAVFGKGEIIEKIIEPELDIPFLDSVFKNHPGIVHGILSSVSYFEPEVEEWLNKRLGNLIVLNSETPLPITNAYKTKSTLGYDRIADAVGAYSLYPGNNVLIIDAGTAITIDLLTAEGEFYGGNISPGIDLRFRALNEFTKKLPLIEKQEGYPFLGKTTEEAILGGVLNGAAFELDGYIDKLRIQYPDLKIILTGGDIKYFVKKLKNIIFVHSNLNLTGLNRILEYNVEKN